MCVVVDTFHFADNVLLGVVTSSPAVFIEGAVKEAWVREELQQSTVPFHGTARLACQVCLLFSSSFSASSDSSREEFLGTILLEGYDCSSCSQQGSHGHMGLLLSGLSWDKGQGRGLENRSF